MVDFPFSAIAFCSSQDFFFFFSLSQNHLKKVKQLLFFNVRRVRAACSQSERGRERVREREREMGGGGGLEPLILKDSSTVSIWT